LNLLIAATAILVRVGLAAPLVLDRVAAVVDDNPILASDVERRVAPALQRLAGEQVDSQEFDKRRREMSRQVLETLIDEQLLSEQLKGSNAEITDDQLEAAVDDVKRQNGIANDAALEQALVQEGMTLKSYREQLRRELEKRKLLNSKVHSQAKVADDDVRAEYERTYVQAGGEQEVHARHVLLALKRDASPEEDARTKARALEIAQRIRAGADFAKVAKELSDGPSASLGGDLGYFKHGVMVAEFENTAFALPVGGVSDPVRTQFGWHVIQVVDKRKAPPAAFDTVKEQIRQKLQAKQVERLTADYLASLRKDAAIEIKLDWQEPASPKP